MRWNKYILALAGVAAFAGGVAAQQFLTVTNYTGLESWNCGLGGPGGPSVFCTSGEMRNAAGTTLIVNQPVTFNASQLYTDYVLTTQITVASTLISPQIPFDGQLLEIVNGSGSNNTAVITLTQNPAASTSQTVIQGNSFNIQSGSSIAWRWSATSNTWFRLR